MVAVGFVVAGTHSGAGKTTVTAGLIGALRARGLRVQPFKAGPDYIDPSYHAVAAGRPCRNLDSWMLPAPALRELFGRASAGADVAVVEGVMGLFDGRSGDDDAGSTAEVAKLLGLPVLLVIDAGAMARSAAAIALGYQRFDPALTLAGVILNRIAGERHYEMCRAPIEAATRLPVLGWLPKDADLALPERHLGLIPTVEGAAPAAFFDRLAALTARQVEVDSILRLAATPVASEARGLFPATPIPRRARIGVAIDRAFSFYYGDTLDLLDAWGAELAPFSPLADGSLPAGVDGLYLGGGFPELYAAGLAANRGMRAAIHAFARAGGVLYAECGGLMYLGEWLEDLDGARHAMVGLAPLRSRMAGTRLTMGYRTARALCDTSLLRRGEAVRGHEFHWSALDAPVPAVTAAYHLEETGAVEGVTGGAMLASYVHLHFGADARLAPRLVDACAAGREGR